EQRTGDVRSDQTAHAHGEAGHGVGELVVARTPPADRVASLPRELTRHRGDEPRDGKDRQINLHTVQDSDKRHYSCSRIGGGEYRLAHRDGSPQREPRLLTLSIRPPPRPPPQRAPPPPEPRSDRCCGGTTPPPR